SCVAALSRIAVLLRFAVRWCVAALSRFAVLLRFAVRWCVAVLLRFARHGGALPTLAGGLGRLLRGSRARRRRRGLVLRGLSRGAPRSTDERFSAVLDGVVAHGGRIVRGRLQSRKPTAGRSSPSRRTRLSYQANHRAEPTARPSEHRAVTSRG